MKKKSQKGTMNGLKEIYVLPQFLFDQIAKENDLTDSNVESFKDTAFISIINANSYDDGIANSHSSDSAHWFKENHGNVLNLEFDDVEANATPEGECRYKAFSEEQAQEVVEFIERNSNKTFLIHCLAGVSRSGAVGLFLYDYYPWVDREWFEMNVKSGIQPNQKVLNELKKKVIHKKYR
jgi:hypothetical protein